MAAATLAVIKLVQDLEPVGVALIKGLLDKMQGMTPDQIAQLTHTINAGTIAEIDAELAKLPPKKLDAGEFMPG